jgi:hypothetical protein
VLADKSDQVNGCRHVIRSAADVSRATHAKAGAAQAGSDTGAALAGSLSIALSW